MTTQNALSAQPVALIIHTRLHSDDTASEEVWGSLSLIFGFLRAGIEPLTLQSREVSAAPEAQSGYCRAKDVKLM